MATSEETCDGNPNFAVICSFITKFGADCGVNISFPYLQQMLEDTKNDYEDLKELHIHLLRRGRKRVNKDKWEKSVIKFCHEYSSVDAWELERFGYKKAKLSVKLDLLKHLLELQFDSNAKFKGEVNKQDAQVLRILPIGRDVDGYSYWYQLDKDYNMRLYKEGVGEETDWNLMCSTTQGLKELLTKLQEKAGIKQEEECKTEPSEPEVITEAKPETKKEDMTSHISESKPCTIIIKTEKKDNSTSSCVSTEAKKDVVMLEPCEASTNSSISPSKKSLEEPKSDKEVKTECPEVLDVPPKKLKSSSEEPCADDSSKKCDNQKMSAECFKMDTGDCTVTDSTVPMDVQTVKSEESTTKTIESNDVEMESVEKLNSNSSREPITKEESVQEKNSDVMDIDSDQNSSALKSDPELKCKGGKIKLYEKWSKEKKKLAAVQHSDKNTEQTSPNSAVALTKLDSNSLPIPSNLEVCMPSEKIPRTEFVKEDVPKKDDYRQPIDETPMDLSVPSRNTNPVLERKSPCEPVASSFKKISMQPSNDKHDMYHSVGYDNMPGHALPLKKKHFSAIKEEPLVDNPENIRKSVIFEVKNNKLSNKYQGNKYDPISSNDRNAPMGGSSHLMALQNMCDNNLMTGSQNNMSAMCEKGIKADDSHKIMHVTNNKASVPDIYDHISKNYSFGAAQISGNKNNADYVATNTLLKPSAQYSKDRNSLSPVGRDVLKPHKTDSLPVVSKNFLEEPLIQNKNLESNKYEQNSSKLLENIPLSSYPNPDFGGKIVPQHPVTVFSADNMKKYSMNEKNSADDNFSTNKSKDDAKIFVESCTSKKSNKKERHKLLDALPEKLPSLPKNTQQNASQIEHPDSKSNQLQKSSLTDTVRDCDQLGDYQIEKHSLKNEDHVEKETVAENITSPPSNINIKNVTNEAKVFGNKQADLENEQEACEKNKLGKIKSIADIALNQAPVLDCETTDVSKIENRDIQSEEPSNVTNLSLLTDDKKLNDSSASHHDLNLKTDEKGCIKVSPKEGLKPVESKSVKEECDTSLHKLVGEDSSTKQDVADKHALKSSSVSDAPPQESDELKSQPKSLLKSNECVVDSIKTDDEIAGEKTVISTESSSLETSKITPKEPDETNKEQHGLKKKEYSTVLMQSKDENELLAIRSEDENEVLAVKSEDENELLSIKSEDENELSAVKSKGKDCLASKCSDASIETKIPSSTASEKICKEQKGNSSQEQSGNQLLEAKSNKDGNAFGEIKVATSEIGDKEKLPKEDASEDLVKSSKSESKNKEIEVDLQATSKSNESQKSLKGEDSYSAAAQKSASKVMPVVKAAIGDLVGKVLQSETVLKEQNVPIENEPSKSVEPSSINEKVLTSSSEDKDSKLKKLDAEDSVRQIESDFKHNKDRAKSENAVNSADVEKTKELQAVCSESVSESKSMLQEKVKQSAQMNSEKDSKEPEKVSVKTDSDVLENQVVGTENKKDNSSKTDKLSIAKSELRVKLLDVDDKKSNEASSPIAKSESGVKLSDIDDKKSNETSSHETLDKPPTLKHESTIEEKFKDNEKSDKRDINATSSQNTSACEKTIEVKPNENNVSINDSKCSKIAEVKDVEKIEIKTLNEERQEIKSESKDSSKNKTVCDSKKVSSKTLINEEAEKEIKPHNKSPEDQNKSLSEEKSDTKSEAKLNACKSSADSSNSEILSDSKISNANSVSVEQEIEKKIKDCNSSMAGEKQVLPEALSADTNLTKDKVVEKTAKDFCNKLSEETEKDKLDTKAAVRDVEPSDVSVSQKEKPMEGSTIESTETSANCETKKPCEINSSSDQKASNSEPKMKMDSVDQLKEELKAEDLQEKTPVVEKNESELMDTVSIKAPDLKHEDAAGSKDDETKNHVPVTENVKDLAEKVEDISEETSSKPAGGKRRSSARRSRSTSSTNKTVPASDKKDVSEPDVIVPELSASEKTLCDQKSVNSSSKDQQVSPQSNLSDSSCKNKTEKVEIQLDEPVEIPLPKRKGSMRKGKKGRNEIVKDENKSTEESSKCEVISDSKAVKKEPLPDALGLYYVLQNACLESKLRHPLCNTRSLEKIPPKKPDKKPNLITSFSMDVEEEEMTLYDLMITNNVKKKRGRLRLPSKSPAPGKAPEVKPKPAPPKPPTPKSAPKKRGSRNAKTIAEVSEKTDFNIPEGFLEILGNTQKETPAKKEPARKARGKNVAASEASLPSSDGESTPIKRSRRIQEQHKKKMSELAVELEREQRMLEQLAKKSTAKKTTPQKVPVKAKEVKNCKIVKTKFQPPVPEETILDTKRTTRKMNSRSRSITKMTLMYEDESKDSEFSTSRETEKSKKRRRGRSGKRGYKPWDLSSESSSSIEEFTEEEEEEPEEQLVFEVNEDEFACEEVDDSAEPVIVRRARTAKKTEGETEEIVNDDTPCLKCGKYDRPEWILLCDKCDNGYHTTCLIPPLVLIPDGDWFCQPCEHVQLCECLQQELRKLESILKQKEREELRKQRLAYVGISLDNVLKPEKKEKSDESSNEDEDEEEDEKENKSERRVSKKESRRELSDDDDRKEKLYGKRSVRARRNINYQFKEYDELIASAIGQEIFEEKVMEEDFQDEDDEKDDGSDKSFTARVQPKRKRKTRLNALDFSDEDDSGEEYKGSNSSDSECTVPQSSNYEGESAGSDDWRVVKTKSKKAPRRKARRGRRDSSEEDWSQESDSYRPVTRRAASQRAVNYREISSDDDEEWGPSKAKKATVKRKKAFSSEESEASYKEKKPKKKARVRKWGSSSDSESEKSLSLHDDSEEEEDDDDGDSSQDSENEWKVKKSKEAKRLNLSINKKVLSTDEESESQESTPAPKKKPNKVVSEESEEEEEEDDDEEEEEDEESSEEEDEESEESDEPAPKVPSVEKKVEKPVLKPKIPEVVKEIPKAVGVIKELKQKPIENLQPIANIKETISVSVIQDKSSLRPPVKKDTTKMVPCVIPYEKSPKSGPGTTLEDEKDKISKVKESNLKTVMPSHPVKTAIQITPPVAKFIESAPPRVNLPPVENKPFSGTIMEPFDEDDPDSDDEVPLERIPTACVPTPLSNKPPVYEKTNEYTPAKELSTFSYSAPEKCFPSTYTSLAPFQDYSSRPSPLKPSLVESYPTNSSSPAKLTPLDTYSRSSSPKGFISLDSYTEARKKKHFYGNPSSEPDTAARPIPPVADNYQGEIRFPPEPYPCPPSPNAYPRRSPVPPQRDPGTPPRMYSQFPDAYAPPRSPEYYQNHQYYASEERIPRPSYQPNYAPSDQGPPYVQNPYVATPVPQPNGGFMIDTLLRARNENEEDELTGVTDIVSYITQE